MRTLLNRFRRSVKERSIRDEWDYQRSRALSPSHAAEIDAIFSRHL